MLYKCFYLFQNITWPIKNTHFRVATHGLGISDLDGSIAAGRSRIVKKKNLVFPLMTRRSPRLSSSNENPLKLKGFAIFSFFFFKQKHFPGKSG